MKQVISSRKDIRQIITKFYDCLLVDEKKVFLRHFGGTSISAIFRK
jgi:hypothetical protein|tara:strand:+ start:1458 stop:1595 length:138 start_codon:yes stop_codon:yes gene_type:complete